MAEAESPQQLASELKSWKRRKPAKMSRANKGVQAGGYAKLSFAIKDQDMEKAAICAFTMLGGERKLGTPPKGTASLA